MAENGFFHGRCTIDAIARLMWNPSQKYFQFAGKKGRIKKPWGKVVRAFYCSTMARPIYYPWNVFYSGWLLLQG